MQRTFIEFTRFETADGTTFYFDTINKFMLTEEGTGMPEIDYLTQRGPTQHGESVYGYRLQPRVLQYLFRENACSRDDYWAARATLLDMLRPNRHAFGEFNQGTLIKTISSGEERAVDVMIMSGPAFAARRLGRWDEWSLQESLRFIAHDPTFYDPDLNTESWVVAPDTANHLVLPFTFDGTSLVFRQSVINEDHEVTYAGTWGTFPEITIDGPIYWPRITNESTGEVIYLDYDVADGETITITLEYGNKSVESSTHGNIIGAVRSTSYLATFHIAPDPEVAGGVNTLNASGSGANLNTAIDIKYYTRYIGI